MMNSDSSGATSADSDIKKSATVSRDRDRDHDQDLIDLWVSIALQPLERLF